MLPTPDQIRMAAYYRWQRRGGEHGRDRDDWAAAEQDLLFALNYRVIAHHRLDAAAQTPGAGPRARRVCRFCEQAAPRTTFSGAARPIPESLGNRTLLVDDECDDCRALFRDGIERDFEAFARACASGGTPAASVGALKGLTRMALAILPEAELDAFADAIEWVCNPDHDLDGNAFGGLGCYVHPTPAPAEGPWTALARRIEDDAPVPYMLYFLGTPGATFELPVPLCTRDEDRDGLRPIVPRVASLHGEAASPGVFVPMAPATTRRVAAARGA